jgi:hypothetical protein
MESGDQAYQHSPFDPEHQQIRLVTLEPGAWSDGNTLQP